MIQHEDDYLEEGKMTNNEDDDHDSNARKMIGREKKKTTLKRVRINDSYNINNRNNKRK